jgi:hypothetical protein
VFQAALSYLNGLEVVMTIHKCEDMSKCECGYIEDEEFELPEDWEEKVWPKPGQVIAIGNG